MRIAEEILNHGENKWSPALIQELQTLLNSDELNSLYFLSLCYRKNNQDKKRQLWIYEARQPPAGKLVAFPTAIAPKQLLDQLPHVHHHELARSSKKYEESARGATLWIKKMQAGAGTSMNRGSYLSQVGRTRNGAKGTDLFIELPEELQNQGAKAISLAEAQILQAIYDAECGKFKSIILHDLVSHETKNSISLLWDKPSFINPNLSYREIAAKMSTRGILRRSGETIQALIPTLNETDGKSGDDLGKLCFDRLAPGGHGLFAFEALRVSTHEHLLPETQGSPLICSIGNGEDLSSTPDPILVGWMLEEKIPIAMVTTEKTSNDLKGGQIALVKRDDGLPYVTIIEQAQARATHQEILFEKLGIEIKTDGQIAFFNTNLALFNYSVLVPKLKTLVDEIGETEFLTLIAPDLILNKKQHKDSDGTIQSFIQLEGAMGSSLLNLDQYWREHYHESLVHFVNIDQRNRTQFFSPIKTAFDYFMQFHSDLFALDTQQMRLIHQNSGKMPSIHLSDPGTGDAFYQDVQTVLESFKKTSLIELSSLKIKGQVSLSHAILRGQVTIENLRPEKFDLTDYCRKNPNFLPIQNDRPVLKDCFIQVDREVEVEEFPLSRTKPNRCATSGQT